MMARYDRIAPVIAPSRAGAFPGWLVLRDIEGNDRDADVCRRARLRFLALRPVRRLLDRGLNEVGRDSYRGQIETVRAELGYLSARDIERTRLARFLHNIDERDASRVIAATLEMAEACVAGGQLHGAEEYVLTALSLAGALGQPRLEAEACVVLARIHRVREEWPELARAAERASAWAEANREPIVLVRARAEEALGAAARGEAETARSILTAASKQMHAAHAVQAEALAQAKLCACELLQGRAEAALEHGWHALRDLDDVHDRAELLEQIGSAFDKLGWYKVAERCFTMVAQRGVDSALRARARARQATVAAAIDAATLFRERRAALLNDTAEWAGDPLVNAFVQMQVGRGCVIVGDVDDARDHLRNAINTARRHNLKQVLADAEDVLSVLEKDAAEQLVTVSVNGATATTARRIAEQLEALPDSAVVAR